MSADLSVPMDALRRGVGLSVEDDVVVVHRLSGEDAFELLDAVSPRPLFVRDGQMLPTVFLRDDGTVFADVMVCVDDLDFLLLTEGPSADELTGWLETHVQPGQDVRIAALDASHRLLGVHGPYAWELLAEVAGPEVVGVGYLRHFQLFEHDAIVFRSGSTGEFGYQLLVPIARSGALEQALRDAGALFDAVDLPREALDLAALENGFYTVRSGTSALTAHALQLLWRVAWDREAPGMDALRAGRHTVAHRVSWWTAPEPPPDALCARWSPALSTFVGLVCVPLDASAPGTPWGPATLVAPPLLHNRSLFVDAQRHSFASRDLDVFPPLSP